MTTIHFPGPGDLGPDEPVLIHDDFRQIVHDVRCGRAALQVLQQLLTDSDDVPLPDAGGCTGLATLLEGAQQRLSLAMDGLHNAAGVLGVELAAT